MYVVMIGKSYVFELLTGLDQLPHRPSIFRRPAKH